MSRLAVAARTFPVLARGDVLTVTDKCNVNEKA